MRRRTSSSGTCRNSSSTGPAPDHSAPTSAPNSTTTSPSTHRTHSPTSNRLGSFRRGAAAPVQYKGADGVRRGHADRDRGRRPGTRGGCFLSNTIQAGEAHRTRSPTSNWNGQPDDGGGRAGSKKGGAVAPCAAGGSGGRARQGRPVLCYAYGRGAHQHRHTGDETSPRSTAWCHSRSGSGLYGAKAARVRPSAQQGPARAPSFTGWCVDVPGQSASPDGPGASRTEHRLS